MSCLFYTNMFYVFIWKKNIVNIKYNDYKLEISFLYYWKQSKVYSAEILIFLKPCFFFRPLVKLTTWCSKILKVTVFMCFIGYIDANQTKTYVWKLWSATSSYYVNYFDIFNSVILFSVKTLNIQRPCKWKYIEWFIFSIKCTFPLTSKGVSQASNLQKGMRYT